MMSRCLRLQSSLLDNWKRHFGLVLLFSAFSCVVQAQDSQYFFQARKGQFFLTPAFTLSHEDYARNSVANGTSPAIELVETTRRDYGMAISGEYGLSDNISVEAGVGGAYNKYKIIVLTQYITEVAYGSATAVTLRLKGRAELPSMSFRYGLDANIAVDQEPEHALWDAGTTVTPYVGLQTSYDEGVVGLQLSIEAVHSPREFVQRYTPQTVGSDTTVQLGYATVEGGQRARLLLFAEGDARRYDVGIALGGEHQFEATIGGIKFRAAETNIFVRGYLVYEFLPKVNFVLDAYGVIGNRDVNTLTEETRRNHLKAIAGVRMEL